MVKVKAVKPFEDIEAHVDRAIGDEWEVTPERFEAINGTQFGVLVEQIEQAEQAEKPKMTRRRTTKKTAEEE